MPSTPKSQWWNWKLTPEELHEQVVDYSTLGFTKSYRGQIVIFFLVVFCLSLLVSFLLPNFISLGDLLIGFGIYGVLIFLGYKGHRWALIALLLYWVLDKVITMYSALSVSPGSTVSGLIFLIAGTVIILKAIQVETERKRLQTVGASIQGSTSTTQ